MKKSYVVAAVAFLMSIPAYPQSKSCDELKSEIAKKIEANGVTSYSLDIVAKDDNAEGKVVGTCEGGSKKIVYTRGAPGSQKPASPDAKQNNEKK